MPSPRGHAPRERQAPENLDVLVREALRGGGSIAAIRAVLEARSEPRPASVPDPTEAGVERVPTPGSTSRPRSPPPTPPPTPPGRPLPSPEATDPRLARRDPPGAPAGADPSAPFRLLADLAARARTTAERRGPAAAADLLADLRRALDAAELAAAPPPGEPPPLDAGALEPLTIPNPVAGGAGVRDELSPPPSPAVGAPGSARSTVSRGPDRQASAVTNPGGQVEAPPSVELSTRLPEAPPPAEGGPELPPYRHPFLLVLDPEGEPDSESRLADALDVDPATVRGLLRARHPVVALRGPDRVPLDRRASRARFLAGHPAAVFHRDELAAIPAAWSLLGRDPEGAWRVSRAPLWRDEPDPRDRPAGEPWEPQPMRLLVPGEVSIRTVRGAASSPRWARDRYTSEGSTHERRVGVLDLHGTDTLIRITWMTTDFRGFPGHDPTSAERSFRGLLEHLSELFPGVRVVGRRTCSAVSGGSGSRVESGWAWWEEHTRCARLLAFHSPR